jgi:hypothetical protein
MNFTDVFRSIQETGGASFNVNTGDLNPTTGYMVSIGNNFERKFSIPITFDDFRVIFRAYMADHWDDLLTGSWDLYIGFWIHEGKLYVDLVENIKDELEAYQLGASRNQIAIHDCKAKQDIKIVKPI